MLFFFNNEAMNDYERIPYSSFCWKFGTTSFRTKEFNRMTEWQLKLLDEFWQKPEYSWQGWETAAPGQNGIYEIKTKYYDWLVEKKFMEGGENFNGKFKTARNKTSGLYDMGFIDNEHRLTEVGKTLLEIYESGDFNNKNKLGISEDSEIYLKQLLKVSNKYGKTYVRPFIIALYLLDRLDFLSNEEFSYLMPLCMDSSSTAKVIQCITNLRNNVGSVDKYILEVILDKDNYKKGLERFVNNDFSENLLLSVSMNRKSAKYDKAYVPLFYNAHTVYMEGDDSKIVDLLNCLSKFQSSISIKWKHLFFKVHQKAKIKKNPRLYLRTIPQEAMTSEKEFKKFFYITMHLFKAKATLEDYLDLNRRYLNLSNCFLFEDNQVKLDIVPKHFFHSAMSELYKQAFSKSKLLYKNCSMTNICPSLTFKEKDVIKGINKQIGTQIATIEEAYNKVNQIRYDRFSKLVDSKFTDNKLITLLDDFKKRADDQIIQLVTDNADVPTIFEYIIGIIWWKVSNKQGKVLDYMKLSLDANLLPITHAAGGEADLVWEYEKTSLYPKHSLLLEATLADSTNQRRMEMEPVSRHLGNHLINTHNLNSYVVFASNYLQPNVINDFRGRKIMFYGKNKNSSIHGMKIIPIQADDLKLIISYHLKYNVLYAHFQKAYDAKEMFGPDWYSKYVKLENSNLCLDKRKLHNIEDDKDILNYIISYRAINQTAMPGKVQTEVQKKFGERYNGMTNKDWYEVVNRYMSVAPSFNIDSDNSEEQVAEHKPNDN